MAGRKTIPTDVKKVMGNPGGKPLVEDGVPRISVYCEPPDHVQRQPYGAETWKTVMPMLIDMGVLTPNDLGSLALYCVAVAMHREAVIAMADEGGMVYESETESGGIIKRKSPYIEVINLNARLAQSFAAEFGLTPSSRARLGVKARISSPLDEFLGKHGH